MASWWPDFSSLPRCSLSIVWPPREVQHGRAVATLPIVIGLSSTAMDGATGASHGAGVHSIDLTTARISTALKPGDYEIVIEAVLSPFLARRSGALRLAAIMNSVIVNRICARKAGGKMFARVGARRTGVSVKCDSTDTAEMTIAAGAAGCAPHLHRAWTCLPEGPPEANPAHRLAASCWIIRAGPTRRAPAALSPIDEGPHG